MEKGDISTRFFHARLRWRLLMNKLKGVHVDGKWREEPQLVKDEILKNFANRFYGQPKWEVYLDRVNLARLMRSIMKCYVVSLGRRKF